MALAGREWPDIECWDRDPGRGIDSVGVAFLRNAAKTARQPYDSASDPRHAGPAAIRIQGVWRAAAEGAKWPKSGTAPTKLESGAVAWIDRDGLLCRLEAGGRARSWVVGEATEESLPNLGGQAQPKAPKPHTEPRPAPRPDPREERLARAGEAMRGREPKAKAASRQESGGNAFPNASWRIKGGIWMLEDGDRRLAAVDPKTGKVESDIRVAGLIGAHLRDLAEGLGGGNGKG